MSTRAIAEELKKVGTQLADTRDALTLRLDKQNGILIQQNQVLGELVGELKRLADLAVMLNTHIEVDLEDEEDDGDDGGGYHA